MAFRSQCYIHSMTLKMESATPEASTPSSEPKNRDDQVPFKGGLSPHEDMQKIGENTKLQQAGGNTDYVIRETWQRQGNTETIEEQARHLKRRFEELRGFGVVTPSEIVIGKSKSGEAVVYVATHHVHGTQLKDLLELRLQKKDEKILRDILPAHYDSLLDYFTHKLRTGEEFLDDVSRNDQYVFGKLTVDSKATTQIYLVDSDGRRCTDINNLVRDLLEIGDNLIVAEMNVGINLGQEKKRLVSVLDEALSNIPEEKGLAYYQMRRKNLLEKFSSRNYSLDT